MSVFDILGKHLPNEDMQPCLDTLIPWPWVCREGRRVGNVLCDLNMHDGTPDLTSPRQLMKAQLDTLRDRHGLLFKSAFEYEFNVFKEGTLEHLGGENMQCWDVRIWAQHQDLFCDLTDILETMGVEVSSLMPELPPGQWEITTEPQEGVRGGDVAFYVKNAVKGFFQTRGYCATFMSMPTMEFMGTGLHLNHSLWTHDDNGQRNAMLDEGEPDKLSRTARHWMAGLLTHAPAITALCCPTLNCYRRLFHLGAPGPVTWGVDDRNSLIRVRNARDNVFLENRLPSGPSSPYLAIAATVAAGLDGLQRELTCPEAMAVEPAGQLPKTLEQALDSLEKDQELRALLGDRFVGCYIKSKRDIDVQLYKNAELITEEKQMEFERKMYMKGL